MSFYCFIFLSEEFSQILVSDPNHLLLSIALGLNALILPSEPLKDHIWIVVFKTVELWARI